MSARWTAEDDEILRAMWDDGAEAKEIAQAVGRTENSIFARATEFGLERRNGVVWTRTEFETLRRMFKNGKTDAEIAEKLGNRSAYAVSRQRMNIGLIRKSNQVPLASRPMMVVGPAKTCQWIEGDPKAGDYTMCGKPSVEGRSYCAEHFRRAYKQPDEQKAA